MQAWQCGLRQAPSDPCIGMHVLCEYSQRNTAEQWLAMALDPPPVVRALRAMGVRPALSLSILNSVQRQYTCDANLPSLPTLSIRQSKP